MNKNTYCYCRNYQKLPIRIIDHRTDQNNNENSFILTENLMDNDELTEIFFTVKKFFLEKNKTLVAFILEGREWVFHIDARTPANFHFEKFLQVTEDILITYANIQRSWKEVPDVSQFSEQISPYLNLLYSKKSRSIPGYLNQTPMGQIIKNLYPKFREISEYRNELLAL